MTESPFRGPTGLFLLGGGALGAWQAAVLQALERRCAPAASVLGFSAGALNGAAYFLGRVDAAVEAWSRVDGSAMRFSPRIFPFSLFSNGPVRKLIDDIHDGKDAKSSGRCRFIVLSSCLAEQRPVYAVFSPQGKEGWAGNLAEHLLASCAIPAIFPPVHLDMEGRRLRLVDGGVSTRKPIDLDSLGSCRDVLMISMVRPDERGLRRFNPLSAADQAGRETILRMRSQAVASLRRRPSVPRIFALSPSRLLAFRMLDFSPRKIADAIGLGAADAEAFLKDPEAFLLK